MAGQIFISYRRSDAGRAEQLNRLLAERGVTAWYDVQLTAGEEWRAGITEAVERADIFVLLYSAQAAQSTEVAKELAVATLAKKLIVPVRLEDIQPTGAFLYELASRNWFDVFASPDTRMAELADELAALARGETSRLTGPAGAAMPPPVTAYARQGPAICVLPFSNMSGDAEQEYFSDGISEDIITDLSKVSALWVAARNTAFTFKGKAVDVPAMARDLGLSHVLEGSVRKAGGRVRITAQLIDASGGHIWAERYDRDLTDIFALQDEIAQAIVGALKIKLLPEEKEAIEARGVSNPEAYRYYLLARQFLARGNDSARVYTAIMRLAKKATEIDPNYAQAWRLLGYSQERLRFLGVPEADGSDAIDRALALDDQMAEAHAGKAQILSRQGLVDEAEAAVERALALAPDRYEPNAARASVYFRQGKHAEAIAWYEKAAALDPTDCPSAGMAASLCLATGQVERARANARLGVERAERIIAVDPDNASAISWLVTSLSTLGEAERALEWIDRALVFDPDDWVLRYNFACALARDLGRPEEALDLLEPIVRVGLITSLQWLKTDPDLDSLREHPRFVELLAAGEARAAGER